MTVRAFTLLISLAAANTLDLVLGGIAVVALLELTRRTTGRGFVAIAELNWVIASESLDGEIVTAVPDILQTNERALLIEVNDIVRQIDMERLLDPPIPLHPATEQWVQANLSGDSP